ncbi:hypothetical protein BDV11DRAFT_144385 [Aspergillus similis]
MSPPWMEFSAVPRGSQAPAGRIGSELNKVWGVALVKWNYRIVRLRAFRLFVRCINIVTLETLQFKLRESSRGWSMSCSFRNRLRYIPIISLPDPPSLTLTLLWRMPHPLFVGRSCGTSKLNQMHALTVAANSAVYHVPNFRKHTAFRSAALGTIGCSDPIDPST